jgi:cytochrome c-type biogenesis protein CcmH/NrfF
MRRLAPLVALLGLLALWPAATALGQGTVKPRASLPDIEDEVMCVQCGTALNISQAPSADRERAFIRRRIAEGKTKAQIKAELVDEYGTNVLGSPPDKGFNVAVWLVPLVLALAALGAVWTTLHRWRRASREEDGEGGSDEDELARREGRALDPDDARRLDNDMAGYDL